MSVKDDHKLIASRISKLLLEEQKPLTVDQICKELKDVDSAVVYSVTEKYKSNFAVFQSVKLTTKVGICKTHCSKGKTCSDSNPDCKDLHICKYHILSRKCGFKNKCTFGHDLKTEHNIKILQENLLNDITVDNLRCLLACPENRTSLTLPRVCKFYNVDKCRHSDKESACPDIHICKHYLYGSCTFDDAKCRRSHSILKHGNKDILSKHGIDVNRTEQEIIEDLRNVLCGIETDENEKRSTESKISTLSQLKSEPVASLSSDNVSEIDSVQSVGLEKSKADLLEKKESVGTESGVQQTLFDQQLNVDLVADSVQFRYLSEIHAIEKRNKTRQGGQEMHGRSSLADASLSNYNGPATMIAYCVGSDDKIHPFYLHGENCEDGVYIKSSKLETGTSFSLQGVYVCTPKIIDYQAQMSTTVSSLNSAGIKDAQKSDEKTVDKQLVYLKCVVILDNSTRMKVKSVPLKKKNDDRVFFQRFHSRSDKEHPWGNFIDTSGHQESALTWKAQGEALQSVCMICYPGGRATGFRVGIGKNYIMTASHVYDFITQSNIRPFGETRCNPLSNEDVFAVFDYLKEGELQETTRFYFKNFVHFINRETDTVVLELQERPFETAMPPPFELFNQPDYTEPFFFIGHSEGKPLAINKVDKIVNMKSDDAQQDIVNIRILSIEHTMSQEYPEGRAYEFEPHLTLENENRFLFHCKFTQGASGSPGLVFLSDGRTVVVSMLLCGYPVWYYDPNMEPFRENWPNTGKCVEQGANFKSVYAFMLEKDPRLCQDIFGKC